MKNLRITLLLLSLTALLSSNAQGLYHELSFGGTTCGNGIMQTLTFGSSDAGKIKSKAGAGGGLQINYALHFNENMSFVTGISARYSESSYGFDNIKESSMQKWQVRSKEESFMFNAVIEDYKETHRSMYIQVPVLFGYESSHPLARWYVNAGLSAQLSVWSKYTSKLGKLSTSGYSEFCDGPLENYPDLGLSSGSNITVSAKPNMLRVTVNGSIETGAKISIGRGKWIYAGIFGEISVLKNSKSARGSVDATNSGVGNIIDYDFKPESNTFTDHIGINSITNTKYSNGGRTYAFGAVVRIGLDFRTSRRVLSNTVRRLR
jgi:hypothetical protein